MNKNFGKKFCSVEKCQTGVKGRPKVFRRVQDEYCGKQLDVFRSRISSDVADILNCSSPGLLDAGGFQRSCSEHECCLVMDKKVQDKKFKT